MNSLRDGTLPIASELGRGPKPQKTLQPGETPRRDPAKLCPEPCRRRAESVVICQAATEHQPQTPSLLTPGGRELGFTLANAADNPQQLSEGTRTES